LKSVKTLVRSGNVEDEFHLAYCFSEKLLKITKDLPGLGFIILNSTRNHIMPIAHRDGSSHRKKNSGYLFVWVGEG
jgi:hypothetical protein